VSPRGAAGRGLVVLVGALALVGLGFAAWWLVAPPGGGPSPPAEPGLGLARPAAEPPAPRSAPQGAAAHEADALGVRLIGTVVRPDPSQSIAVVERSDGTDAQLLSIGDALLAHPEFRVTRIEAGFAEVAHAGRTVRLDLSGSRSPERQAFLEALRSLPPQQVSPEERERRRAMAQRLRARMNAGRGSGTKVRGNGLLDEGRARPVYEDGALVAVEIDEIEPGGLYDQLGFSTGDRITSVNRVPIGDATTLGGLVEELALSDEIAVTVEHDDGSQGEITIPVEELLDELRNRSPEELIEEYGGALPVPETLPEPDAPAG
jgi:type II secretory pathway component PulC